jgi:hypothetical protein
VIPTPHRSSKSDPIFEDATTRRYGDTVYDLSARYEMNHLVAQNSSRTRLRHGIRPTRCRADTPLRTTIVISFVGKR